MSNDESETVKWSQIHNDCHEEDREVQNALVAWLDSQDVPPGTAIGVMAELIIGIAEKFLSKEEKSDLADSLILYLATRLIPERARRQPPAGLPW